MSGGHFDYQQYRISDIAATIEDDLNGRELDEDDIHQLDCDYKRGWVEKEYYEYCKQHRHTPPCDGYGEKTISEFKRGYAILRIAEIYAQRIDWIQSGDDGEDSFHERLAEDLAELADELKEKGFPTDVLKLK